MKLSGLCLVACVMLVPACKHHVSQYARPGDDPHDTDSLYALYHQILNDSDPVRTWSETECEMYHLMNKLGPDIAMRRLRAFFDTVYTPTERRHREANVDPKLWYRAYPLDDASCIAEMDGRYDPGVKIDTTHRPPQPPR
ncbi:MAG: hypothetical protein WBQ26_03865 [Gemmatimonadaceae bacterium]